MRIDLKPVPSEKVRQQPEPVRVVKDDFGLWCREEVICKICFSGSEAGPVEMESEAPGACWTAPLVAGREENQETGRN